MLTTGFFFYMVLGTLVLSHESRVQKNPSIQRLSEKDRQIILSRGYAIFSVVLLVLWPITWALYVFVMRKNSDSN